ncbi:VOC family protein [Oryzobacter sp. R7]|uniref:VOC family protein n=1 Tax=Oryzobacter faecalis TaxID=3388656 RepID=UPI00398D46DB
MSSVRWAWIFLDTPSADAATSWRFWAQATATSLAPVRGEDGEFSTLLPARGRAWVKVQAVGEPGAGVHLDLDVDDVGAEAARAEALGAVRVGAIGDTVVILRSPGGFTFCLTTWDGDDTGGPVREGLPVALDQVCLDVPRAAWDAEVRFWEALTGWELRDSDEPGFAYLVRPPDLAVRLLLQRLDEDDGPVRGHVDLACADRGAETARHVSLGARVVREHRYWTVMADPVGRVYCLTSRSPQPPPGP